MDLVGRLKGKVAGAPASSVVVGEAEKLIGFAFPPLLKELYLQVANGGFGPSHKILGVDGGYTSDEGDTIVDFYIFLSDTDPYDELWQWPEGMVAFCNWGSGVYSCFDTTKDGYPVCWFDPNKREIGEPMEKQFIAHKDSLAAWFDAWLDGDSQWAKPYG